MQTEHRRQKTQEFARAYSLASVYESRDYDPIPLNQKAAIENMLLENWKNISDEQFGRAVLVEIADRHFHCC